MDIEKCLESIVECNLYQYTGNNPVNMVDLWGREAYMSSQMYLNPVNHDMYNEGSVRVTGTDEARSMTIFTSLVKSIDDPAVSTTQALKVINSYPAAQREHVRYIYITAQNYTISPAEDYSHKSSTRPLFSSYDNSDSNSSSTFLRRTGFSATVEGIDRVAFKGVPAANSISSAVSIGSTLSSDQSAFEKTVRSGLSALGVTPLGTPLNIMGDAVETFWNSLLDEQGDALVNGHGEVGDFSGIDAGAGFAQ